MLLLLIIKYVNIFFLKVYILCSYEQWKSVRFQSVLIPHLLYNREDPFSLLLVILVSIAGMWYVFVQGESLLIF